MGSEESDLSKVMQEFIHSWIPQNTSIRRWCTLLYLKIGREGEVSHLLTLTVMKS